MHERGIYTRGEAEFTAVRTVYLQFLYGVLLLSEKRRTGLNEVWAASLVLLNRCEGACAYGHS